MDVTIWGARGSVPSPRSTTQRYGGNTACVEVRATKGSVVVLDAGTGICALGRALDRDVRRIDILLSHLHMDHILGLGFFAPLFESDVEVHLWGPSSVAQSLHGRLTRYLSPPLFPVRLRDLPCGLTLHDLPFEDLDIPGLRVTAALVCHPGPTVGYRLDDGAGRMAYLSDHEPSLGARAFPDLPQWTSGLALADRVDVLIHDAQYSAAEYAAHVGWGHSSIADAVAFARVGCVGHLLGFHHDPDHDDDDLDALYAEAASISPDLPITPAFEGMRVVVRDADTAAQRR